ncbi:MAG TPA: DinB family protein [Flavipsychrobacter sp.]|nr:DinB family protein [Flavipsychrobacter sp.]
MENSIFINTFDLHNRLFKNTLDGVNINHSSKRLNKETNHMNWIAGHLVSSRHSFANMLGINEPEKYATLFADRKGLDENQVYPHPDDIQKEWDKISILIRPRLAGITNDVLNTPLPQPIPVNDQTVKGMITFLLDHEAYHIGQLGILRKHLGYPAMSYR